MKLVSCLFDLFFCLFVFFKQKLLSGTSEKRYRIYVINGCCNMRFLQCFSGIHVTEALPILLKG